MKQVYSNYALAIALMAFLFLPFSCKKDSDSQSPAGENLPKFTNPSASPVSDITSSSARFSVTISADGGAAITARGVVWNSAASPTVALSSKTTDSSGTGSFTSSLTGLAANTKYFARPYATNANGTSYGAEFDFTTENVPLNLPVFTNPGSTPVSAIGSGAAQFSVTISADGGFSVTARGVCWSTTAGPTVSLTTKTSNGTGIGTFSASITGLSANTKYYARAYATNSKGTAYGTEFSFTTLQVVTISDVDGNEYQTIQIGTQTWMKENLRTSRYKNGATIPTGLSTTEWSSATSGAYALYGNVAANNQTYGKLYNWYTVADTRGLCPAGWHVPADAEWKTLESQLGMTTGDVDLFNWRGDDQNVGGKLKAVSSLWNSPNTGATNESGFSALPGGYRDGEFGTDFNIGQIAQWWCSDEGSPNEGYYRNLTTNGAGSLRNYSNKKHGRSVRCLKD